MQLNSEIAELCGIILGDGNMHKTDNRITISGSTDDVEYFEERVIPLFEQGFPGINPRLVELKGKNAFNLEIHNKAMFVYFTDFIGIQRGPKDNVQIPQKIRSNPKLHPHFLRGVFDTDGFFRFSKQTREYAYYPRICISLAESPFSHQLGKIIKQIGFPAQKYVRLNHGYKPAKNLITYEISGYKQIEKWMTQISPANPVQIAKYIYWKKFGRHEPFMTHADRILRIDPGRFELPSTGPEPVILGR